MAAAVLVPMSQISLNGGVLPPSANNQNSPRHGRSRGASIAKGKGGVARGRGYSVVDERDAIVAKALAYVLRRSQASQQQENSEGDDSSDEGKLSADAEGWVDLEDVLDHPKVVALSTNLAEVQRAVASSSTKGRLALKQTSEDQDASSSASSYAIRRVPANTHRPAPESSATPQVLTPLTLSTPDLPAFAVFETSYPKYHLILTSGGIKRAGGQPQLTFAAVDGEQAQQQQQQQQRFDADVSIWIDLRAAMEAQPAVEWKRTESGAIVTSEEVGTALWTKAVARRGDLGVLFQDGQVRKEVPVGLRGKGAKAKKGKGVLKSGGKDDASASGSE